MAFMLVGGCSSSDSADDGEFSYSDGIDENGFWKGITALDYVELFDYDALPIPKEVHVITDEELKGVIDEMMAGFSPTEKITDRAVEKGDEVNIDYVGSVDGVEFGGGSTEGEGTDVIAGDTNYIDDFLDQIIGCMPGDTIDIEVTFPKDYFEASLQGKDAVFVTTINYIIGEPIETELTDEFVEDHFSEDYGWKTVTELEEGIRNDVQQNAIREFVYDYFINEVKVSSVPEVIISHYENMLLSYYTEYAEYYSLPLDEFLSTYAGVADVDELLESSRQDILDSATYALVCQAMAEDMGYEVTEAELDRVFAVQIGSNDFSEYVENYGLPYIKQYVLTTVMFEHVAENAVLA